MQEVAPDFKKPTPTAQQYGREIASYEPERYLEEPLPEAGSGARIQGQVKWVHGSQGRIVYLTEDVTSEHIRQRLYLAESGHVRQLALPSGHVVVRPQWAGEGVIFERWNPWALPATGKVRRYVASWVDPSLRPEAALYVSTPENGGWRFLTPGHSLAVSPDGRLLAFLRSGALLAGYYSVHVWQPGTDQGAPIVSLREHDSLGTKSFSLRWSRDSEALQIHGATGGFSRRGSRGRAGDEGIPVDLLYLTSDRTVYDLNFGD